MIFIIGLFTVILYKIGFDYNLFKTFIIIIFVEHVPIILIGFHRQDKL